jgi:glutamate-1-semialdehyde aminotransferase
MKQRVQEGKKFYTAGNESRWKREARELTDSLRAAWERTVEEVLLNRTVERFSRQVATQRLKLATDLTASDYERVESAMTQLSEWTPAHDDAAALQWNVPSPDDMDRGIGELESLVAEVRKRRA